MKIDLAGFINESKTYLKFTGKVKESEINLKDRFLTLDGPIEYKAEIFTLDNGERELIAEVDYRYEEPCNRCLKPTIKSVKTKLSGQLIERIDVDSEEDDGIIYYENYILDLEPYIIAQVYVSLPMQTICSEQCKGLCSTCGADLNEEDCGCTEHTIDPRMAQLKDLFPDNK